ncbi:MAG: hypothetical protein KZQ78_07400 [Candidatus Thiodiazotropha sp. (ex Ustalcina ferruginea)]|nr:hypothetical protein [Candidatus Thiodiazotropha sp. (ex Ustalcina ferruginea)]
MDNNIVDTAYSLRLVGIEESTIKDFKITFPNIEVEYRKKKGSKFILIFEMNSKLDYSAINDYFNKYCTYEKLDIFVSITSETDNYIVDLPEYVIQAIRKLPAKVCISFIGMY